MILHHLIVGRREDVDRMTASETPLYVLQDGSINHDLVSTIAILMTQKVLLHSNKKDSTPGG